MVIPQSQPRIREVARMLLTMDRRTRREVIPAFIRMMEEAAQGPESRPTPGDELSDMESRPHENN